MPSFDILKKELHVTFTKEREPSPAALQKIIDNIATLTETNFNEVAPYLVEFGLYVYKQTTNNDNFSEQYQEWLEALYSQLRKIKKLTTNRDLSSLKEIWQVIDATLYRGQQLQLNLIEGSFAFYYNKHHVNQLLADPNAFNQHIIRWIIEPSNIALLDPKNFDVVFLRVILYFFDKLTLLLEFAKKHDLLSAAMSCALAQGHCQVVQDILQQGSQLPKNIAAIGLTYQAALASENIKLIKTIEAQFSKDDLMKYALKIKAYRTVKHLLDSDAKLPADLNSIAPTLEVAAACGETAFLKQILDLLKGNIQIQAYTQHILPYFSFSTRTNKIEPTNIPDKELQARVEFYGDNQALYHHEFKRAVAIIHYHMRKKEFTCSLNVENFNANAFGPKQCGHLRKLIAYTTGDTDAASFGSIRSFQTTTNNKSKRYSDYFQSTHAILSKHGVINPKNSCSNNLDTINNSLTEYQVKHQHNMMTLPLTTYIQLAPSNSTIDAERLISTEWHHTHHRYFLPISDVINELFLKFSSQISSQESGIDNQQALIAPLKTAAEIFYFFCHLNFYGRGSAACSEMILAALFKELGLEYSMSTAVLPDCKAITQISLQKFITDFPSILGFNSYKALIDGLSSKKYSNQYSFTSVGLDMYLRCGFGIQDLISDFFKSSEHSINNIVPPEEPANTLRNTI